MKVLVAGESEFFNKSALIYLSKIEDGSIEVESILIGSVKKEDIALFDDFDVIVLYIPAYSRNAVELFSLLDVEDKKILFLTYSNLFASYIRHKFRESNELCYSNFKTEELLHEINGLTASDIKIKTMLLKRANNKILTDRETEIVALLAIGYTQVDVAKALYLSEKTIQNHVASIKRKLEASTVTEAIASAIRFGVID